MRIGEEMLESERGEKELNTYLGEWDHEGARTMIARKC